MPVYRRLRRGTVGNTRRRALRNRRVNPGGVVRKHGLRNVNGIYAVKQHINGSNIARFVVDSSASATMTQSNNNLCQLVTPASTGSHYGAFSLSFNAGDIYNVTNYFRYLFDTYRLRKVKIDIRPVCCSSMTWVGGSMNIGAFLHSVTDHDDDATFGASNAGLDLMKQRKSYKCYNLTAGKGKYSYTVYPQATDALYSGAAFTGYGSASSLKWVDMASYTIPYYGYKFVLQVVNGTAAACTYQFSMDLTYYIELKDLI